MRLVTVALPFVVALTAHAQAPVGAPRPTPPLAIAGRVVADETGDPVPNVRVTVSQPGGSGPVVLTDGDGRFRLSVPTDVTRIVASKTGFAPETVVPMMDGAPTEIRLRRAASISGRIVDEFGQPVVDARVNVASAWTQPGSPSVAKSTDTDDRGEYRVGGLGAGTFLVSVITIDAGATARDNGGRMEFSAGPLKTYFPRAPAIADAQPVVVGNGDYRSSVDIIVPGSQSGGPPFGMFGGVPGRTFSDHPAADPAAIRGQVVDQDGRGLPHAFVRLFPRGVPGALRAGRADAGGRFEFADLAAGAFRVTAYVPGYTASRGDELVSPGFTILGSGPLVTLAPAQERDGLEITLTRLGVIAGRVLDELGDPVEGARVQLLQVGYQAGRRRLVPAGGAERLTDDRGEYRLHDLPQGRYIVSASVGSISSADVPDYARSYFPGTPDPSEAQFVTLADADRVGVDVALARTRTALVRGHIFSAAGEPTMGGHVELRPSARSPAAAFGIPVGARLLPEGIFEFPNVPSGEYVVVADRNRSNRSSEGEFGSTIVDVVDTDVTNLVVQMSAGSSIAGRFTFDTDDQTPPPARNTIEFSPVGVDPDETPSSVASAEINEDWTFTMTGINGPRRLDLVRVPPEWMLKGVRAHDIDITDRAITFGRKDQSLADVEVVLTDRVTGLSGRIADEDGRPVAGAHVMVFSDDRGRWYPGSRFLREVTTAQDGLYQLTGLPSGSYYAAAATRLPAEGEEAWQDPTFLETLASRATTVTLDDGQRQELNLKVAWRPFDNRGPGARMLP
jgi:protocatechuate 3,4-dioxygenase beta subunit